MEFSIVPYNGDSHGFTHGFMPGFTPMKPWPALAANAYFLKDNTRSGESIFYFDAAPPESAGNNRQGQDPPPVFVLIHGLGDEADSWRHLIPLLNARGFRALALDLPGFGRSVTTGKVSLKNHAAAVLKLIDAVIRPPEPGGVVTTPVFLAGNSMGALVAEAAALEKPDRGASSELVRGIVLLDGSIPGGPANPGLFALAKLLFSRKWYRAYRENPEGAWLSLYPYYADLDSLPGEDREFLRQRVMARVESSAQEKAFFATQRSIVRTYITEISHFSRKIRNYKGKILLIWGEKDRIIPLSSVETFRGLRHDIKLEVIPGAGHLPQQEKPEETAGIIAEFAGVHGAGR